MDKFLTKQAIILCLQNNNNGIYPSQLRQSLEKQGFSTSIIRDMICFLLDTGVIFVDSNLKIHLENSR